MLWGAGFMKRRMANRMSLADHSWVPLWFSLVDGQRTVERRAEPRCAGTSIMPDHEIGE
jgi:hypothetical protein